MVKAIELENKINSLLNGNCKATVFDCLESTNTYLKKLAQQGAKEGTVIIAKSQTKGRGRLGRSFISSKGGLYLSLLLRPYNSAEASLKITVAAAVAVALAIEKVSKKKCGIKWVNDVYINGKKVSGILTEGAINPINGSLDYAVLGIGVNIVTPKGGFKEEIKDIADAVFDDEKSEEVLPYLAAEIVNTFMSFYENLENKAYMEEYKNRSVLTGKTVSFIKADILYTARVLGIDDDAKLILDQNGDIVKLNAGEVSVKVC